MRSWPSSAPKARARRRVPATIPERPPAPGAVRILGLDPGLRHTGWGVIDAVDNRLVYVADGVIEPDPGLPLAQRLHALFAHVSDLVARLQPHECAVEDTFVNKNPVSTLKLGHARAAALLGAAAAAVPVFEYKPNLVKKSVVGAGHADKDQVIAMIGVLLPGSKAGSKDAADALATAVCHAHHRVSAKRLARVLELAR